jgi:hypothetical protein
MKIRMSSRPHFVFEISGIFSGFGNFEKWKFQVLSRPDFVFEISRIFSGFGNFGYMEFRKVIQT